MPNFDLINWMSSLNDDVKLNQIVLPATHDSGMNHQSWGSGYNVVNPVAWVAKPLTALAAVIDDAKSGRKVKATHDNFVTQYVSVGEQLLCGARQFDLGMAKNFNEYKAFHGAAGLAFLGMRRYGETWSSICAGLAGFMRVDGQSEVVILKMDKQSDDEYVLADTLSKALRDANVPQTRSRPLRFHFVDQEPLSKLRGRILLCGKKKFLSKIMKKVQLHPCISLCEWQKDETGFGPEVSYTSPQILSGSDFPVYLLLGGSDTIDATGERDGVSARSNPLVKQKSMKRIFQRIKRGAGMRGIWFNTYSYLRDIETYHDEVWSEKHDTARDLLWLNGSDRQNVASLDFIDPEKGKWVVSKNHDTSFRVP